MPAPTTALWLDGEAAPRRLSRLAMAEGRDESWLQALLHDHPELVPLQELEPGAGPFLPLCRELPLPRPGAPVYLDLFGVTPQGRPVLVECKLWRNPQGRREVVAQILEYAALLRRLSLADLEAALRPRLGISIWDRARAHPATPDEAAFNDALARSLRASDLHLVIAGDGIREDLHAMAEHLRDQGARLMLLEIQLWRDEAGGTLAVPHVPFRTEVLRQRLLLDPQGAPVAVADEGAGEEEEARIEDALDPDRATDRARKREENRRFWQAVIDAARFDHPDQPPPRHGGTNSVHVPLPSPARRLTAYRWSGSQIGLWLLEEEGSGLIEALGGDIEQLRRETGLPELRFHAPRSRNGSPLFTAERPLSGFPTEEAQRAWLLDAANRLVTALRPRLALLSETAP